MIAYDLTIIIPCYNEEKTIGIAIENLIKALAKTSISFETIIVNDGSTDQTANQIKLFSEKYELIEIHHPVNKGKGASIRSALSAASGEFFIVQDADLEYDPNDIWKLFYLVSENKADVVYGSRFRGSEPHRVLFFFHTIGNKFLTFFSNVFTGLNLTDMETGYKLFNTQMVRNLSLKENRFGFEPEITAKISRIRGVRVYEVGISYYGRTYAEGKKIRWQDGLRAIYCVLKYNLFQKK